MNSKSECDIPCKKRKTDKSQRRVGLVLACGQNDVGQLGIGRNVTETMIFTSVPGLDDIVDIAAGAMHTLCLSSSGNVYSVGCNDEGALGRESDEDDVSADYGLVKLPGPAIQISAGDSHSIALLQDRRVFGWGTFRDETGQIGLTTDNVQMLPVELAPGKKVIKIVSGYQHTVLLTEQNMILTCGCNNVGQLGRVESSNINIGYYLKPREICSDRFTDIWAGGYTTFAKFNDGIYVSGLNNYHQLGLKCVNSQHDLIKSNALQNRSWTKITGGNHHTLALDDSGKVYSLGRQHYGMLGLSIPQNVNDDIGVPTLVTSLQERMSVDVACGPVSSFAISDNVLYSWGCNVNYQLGTGDEEDKYEPTPITGGSLTSLLPFRICSGGQHSVLLAARLNN